jgi:N-sulfoglucosamine sulfohydrolase
MSALKRCHRGDRRVALPRRSGAATRLPPPAILRALLAGLALHAITPCVAQLQNDAGDGTREEQIVVGWTVRVSRALRAHEPNATARALGILQQQLEEIVRVVPAQAVAALRKVPLYLSPPYPGHLPTAEFHPDAGWLRRNGRDPAMARGVEFTDIPDFEREANRMPNFTLHELAHAYHHRELAEGPGEARIKAAYAKAKAAGTYDRVERWHGPGRPVTFERAYAMANPAEYFAETTEAYFSRNDFFPFTRAELKRHDPEMFELLELLWAANVVRPRVLVVKPVILRDDDGANPARSVLPKRLVDQVYTRAGLEILYREPVPWSFGAGRRGETNLDAIVRSGHDQGVIDPDPRTLTLLFVSAVDGRPGPMGRGLQNGNICFISLGPEGKMATEEEQAFVVSHEIGHCLGLRHAADDPAVPEKSANLQGDGPYASRLTAEALHPSQVATILKSPLVQEREAYLAQTVRDPDPGPLGRSAAEPPRPNILLVTADDLGCVLSCCGETRIDTPNFDALAAQGVRFEHAYVAQSSCSPSRASLLTGRWPHRNGQVGLAHLGFRMHDDQPNLPALLKRVGYRTGIVGKLHVEPAAEFPFDWTPKQKMAAGPTRDVRWVAEQCRAFFADARAAGRPFFHYVNYIDPHGPLNVETDQVDGLPEKPLKGADIKQPLPLPPPTEQQRRAATAHLLNSILRLDAGMGLLLAELDRAGFASNTIVVFVGDNGLAMPRGKTTSYEPGVRVPMIVRWPGVAKAGCVSTGLVSLVDLMPTLLDAAGARRPDGLDGVSLRPLLADEPGGWTREFLFTEMNFHEPDIFRPQRTIRDARYKLMLNLEPAADTPATELFAVVADPGETRNLAGAAEARAEQARLEKALEELRKSSHDPLLDPERVRRWREASDAWAKLPRVKAGVHNVVKIPVGGLEALK